MNKRLAIALGVGFLLVASFGTWLLARKSQSTNALLRYKAELRAKGEKLTFAELATPQSPHTNASQIVLTNAAAALGRLPIHPGVLDLRSYSAAGLARVAWRDDPAPWAATGGLSRPGSWQDFAAQLPAVEPEMRAIREALKDPEAEAGPFTNLWGRRVNFVALRNVAQWLMGATLSEVRQGHLEAGLQDLEALAAMARMERDELTLVAQMIRVAISGLGTTTTWEVLQAPGWTELQLERMQRAWEAVDLIDGVEKGFLGERASLEECWSLLRSAHPQTVERMLGLGAASQKTLKDVLSDYLLLPIYKHAFLDGDELFGLQLMEENLTACRLAREHRPWPEIQQRLTRLLARITAVANSPTHYRYMLSLIAIPNFTKAASTTLRNETERRMTVAALALERFRLRNGKYPPGLDALVPDFLAEPPYDPMSGRSLCYRLKPDGSFVLYSTGEDGKDDGGDARPPAGARFGLWEGRDAVWPSAVQPY